MDGSIDRASVDLLRTDHVLCMVSRTGGRGGNGQRGLMGERMADSTAGGALWQVRLLGPYRVYVGWYPSILF